MSNSGKRSFLALLGASAAMALGGAACEPRNQDINTVQPGYVRKAIFQTEHEWYYRRTIAKSETTQQYIVEGHGDIPLDRVRFEIQENLLIAYKPYEAIPGAQMQELPGGDAFFKGTVLAAWPIASHFDIQRGYDPATNNQTNVITENAADRVWYERDYMRVDWAANVVEGTIYADYSGYWFPVNYVSTGKRWTNLETSPTDPYASRFQDDYIEVTDHALLGMDLLMCAAFVGYSWAGYGQCGFGEAKVRHSFMRVTEKSDYIPRSYPDSVVRTGADGNPIYDPDTGEVVREPIFNRFGVFRVEIPTYDRGYGTTESGRLFRAMLFNLWKRHTDGNGNVIPVRDREPKPIIYYLNAEYPERYRRAAAEVAAEYNRVYSNMVADLKGVARDQVPDMFEIRDNDCNEANVLSFVSNNPNYLFAVERAVCKDGEACSLGVADLESKVGFGNLTTVCTSLEAATLDPMTGVSEFKWQRIGDARYNMVVWLNNPQRSPWGGYGPMHADARTGETVSATAFLRGFSYEVGAANIVDYIEFMNDETSVEDVIYGQTIRRQVAQTLERKKQLETMQPSRDFLDRMGSRIDRLGTTKEELLPKPPNPNHQAARYDRVKGTRVEEKLINDLQIAMASEGTWRPGMEIPEALRDRASPIGRMKEQNPLSAAHRTARAALGHAGYCFLEQDFDPHWAGLALALKDMTREQRFDIVANRLIKHVMLHELGHNVGLSHNFEGTYDALNYPDRFWDLHWASDEEKLRGQYDEFRHTTVMEYMSGKGAFGDFLGKYDEAALRFAYGNQVQTFDSASVDPALQGGQALRDWRYYSDYRKIPDHLCGDAGCGGEDVRREVIRQRSWVDFNPQSPPVDEVPYLFCDNYFDHMTPFCATFDYGSNLREVFANYYTNWSSYFFFNNFIRDRLVPLGWSPVRALIPVYYAYDFIDVITQYFYFLSVVDPTFRNTDLREDMATTLANGLNMAAEIIATPEPVRMCPWPGSDPPVYIRHWFLNDCDEYADLNSQYAIDAQQIHPPLGDARPATLNFTEDYEDWDWALVGSFFDKSNVLFLLGMTEPRLLRFDYQTAGIAEDDRHPVLFISLYRLFEPELRAFYDQIANFDGFFLRQSIAQNLGSYWCRDEEAPGVAHLGHFEPRRMIDPVTNLALPGPSTECLSPAYIYPTLLSNTPYTAMLVAHWLFSSDFDAQLDMGKAYKVFVKGADDDFVDWDSIPNCETAAEGQDCYCGLVDSLTGLDYRALNSNSGIENLGCRIIESAREAQDAYDGSNGNPFYKDNWRQWIERLEYARDLYRFYHSR